MRDNPILPEVFVTKYALTKGIIRYRDLYALILTLFDKWRDLDRTVNGKSLRDWSLLDLFNLVSASTEM